MKLDMDLARQILIMIEDHPDTVGGAHIPIAVDGRSDKEVSYHVRLLADAGFVQAKSHSNLTTTSWSPIRLTWEGHQFLMSARSDTLWEKAKNLAIEKTGSLTLEFVKMALTKVGTDLLSGS